MPKVADSASASRTDAGIPPSQGSTALFYLTVAITVLYCGFLIGLARFTSNPVMLNPVQIKQSSLIVSGSFDSSENGGVRIRVHEVWKADTDQETLFVRNLTATHFQGHELWIVPLQQAPQSEYVVTPLKNASSANSKQLLYPADPDTLDKLKSLLSPDRSAL